MTDHEQLQKELSEIKAELKTLDSNSRAYRTLDKERVDLEARLTGRVPFEVTPEGVRVAGGTLAAIEPGRLSILRETEDGFRISEEDLAMRGAGDVIGTAQSGLPRFRIADLERQAGLMQVAQADARAFLERDPDMTSERGRAIRMFLWLMEQDQAIRLIKTG